MSVDQIAVLLHQFHLCVNTFMTRFRVLSKLPCMLLTSCSRSTAGRELATWTGAHVGSGTEAIATWIPANCWKDEQESKLALCCLQQYMMKQNHPTPICYLFLELCGIVQRWVKEGKLTNNTLVPSRQSLPAWTAVWVEARATHIGSDEDKKERTNKFTNHPDLPNIF